MGVPEHVTATFRVVTPLFLGDAEREATRFSLASFKGALRFWWRAREWSVCLAAKGGEAEALRELHRREAWLFGTAGEERKRELGQSRVLLRLVRAELGKPLAREQGLTDGEGRPVGPGARYLGYGLMGASGARQGKLDRSCFPAGGAFTVELALKGDVRDEEKQGLSQALRLLGLLGGLGARSRRGWGSLSLVELTGDPTWESSPTTIGAYRDAVKAALAGPALPKSLPPFTAFSERTRLEIVRSGDSALPLLDQVGRAMQRYRAWEFKGSVNGQPSEQNFKDDHDWFKAPGSARFKSFVPERTAFGLPHNYGKRTGVTPEDGERRASPLLIHIHELGEVGFVAVLLLMPATFTATGKLTLVSLAGKETRPAPAGWEQVLHDFIGPRSKPGAPPPKRKKNYFPSPPREVILP